MAVCSNTYDVVDRRGYSAVLVESDPEKYASSAKAIRTKIEPLYNAYVGWSATDGLDHLLRRHAVPQISICYSVDVDGNDYNFGTSTKEFRPSWF